MRKQREAQGFMREGSVNSVVCGLDGFLQMLSEALRFRQGCMDEIPGPQAKQSGKGLLRKSAFSRELQRARIGVLHLLDAPALRRSQRVAERNLQVELHLAA